jgi:ribosomal protein S17E
MVIDRKKSLWWLKNRSFTCIGNFTNGRSISKQLESNVARYCRPINIFNVNSLICERSFSFVHMIHILTFLSKREATLLIESYVDQMDSKYDISGPKSSVFRKVPCSEATEIANRVARYCRPINIFNVNSLICERSFSFVHMIHILTFLDFVWIFMLIPFFIHFPLFAIYYHQCMWKICSSTITEILPYGIYTLVESEKSTWCGIGFQGGAVKILKLISYQI